MSTLKTFSDKEHAYQARQTLLREQCSIQLEFEDLQAELEQERAARERAQASAERERAAREQTQASAERERAAKQAALTELEQLKRQLSGESDPSGSE